MPEVSGRAPATGDHGGARKQKQQSVSQHHGHGHGTSVVPVVTPMGTKYNVSPLYFFMPDLWQVTLDATVPQAGDAARDDGAPPASDSTTLTFCVQG